MKLIMNSTAILKNEITVSVCCLSYNHEKYIRKTLDSILMQNTNFRFEIIINDDASTDGTQLIINEYVQRYPDLIIPIYHKTNEFSQRNKVLINLFKKARGKYIALCECDDYWSNPNKLQMQYHSLESHCECIFCTHLVEHINESGEKLLITQPKLMATGIYNASDLMPMCFSSVQSVFHLSSYFIRSNVLEEFLKKTPRYFTNAPVGDIFLQLFLFSKGSTYYLNYPCSYYRRNSIGSWTNRNMYKKEKLIQNNNSLINAYELFSQETEYQYSDLVDDYIKYLKYKNLCIEMDYTNIKESYKIYFSNEKSIKKLRIIFCSKFKFMKYIYEKIKYVQR